MDATSTRPNRHQGFTRARRRVLVTAADAATLRRARRVYRHDRLEVIDGIGDALSRCAKTRFDVIICGLPRDGALAKSFRECLEILNPTLTPCIMFPGC